MQYRNMFMPDRDESRVIDNVHVPHTVVVKVEQFVVPQHCAHRCRRMQWFYRCPHNDACRQMFADEFQKISQEYSITQRVVQALNDEGA